MCPLHASLVTKKRKEKDQFLFLFESVPGVYKVKQLDLSRLLISVLLDECYRQLLVWHM